MFPKTIKSWLVVLLVLISLGYLTHNKLEQKRLARYGTVAEQPVQESTDAPAMQLMGYEIEPVARYEIRAKVLSIERYRTGHDADLSPVDFALGWGPMSDNAITKRLNITQGNRWYQYSWSDTQNLYFKTGLNSSTCVKSGPPCLLIISFLPVYNRDFQ